MSHENTFEELHLAIQEAFNFDNDHLYEFYIGGSRRTAKIIFTGDPSGGIENDITLGEMAIYKGQKIKYVFDFGDMWEFDITVTNIDKNVPIPVKPEIIEIKGEAPEQYPDWDWEWIVRHFRYVPTVPCQLQLGMYLSYLRNQRYNWALAYWHYL